MVDDLLFLKAAGWLTLAVIVHVVTRAWRARRKVRDPWQEVEHR